MSDQMATKLQIAHIEWGDADSLVGWHNRDVIEGYIQSPPSQMKSVGWLLHDGDDCVILAQSVGTHKAADLIKIPRAMVRNIHVLADPTPGEATRKE